MTTKRQTLMANANYPSSADQKTLREDFYANPSKKKQKYILNKYGLYFKLPTA